METSIVVLAVAQGSLVGILLKGEGGRSTWILSWGLVEKEDEELEERVDLLKKKVCPPRVREKRIGGSLISRSGEDSCC